ncbi:MAG: hypothetical protein ACE5JM_10315, partial [Armatimonadota bacterium]
GRNQPGDTPPILTARLERRGGSILSLNLLPFLQQSGLGFYRGILPSPGASTLTGQGGSFTTTGSRLTNTLLVASTVDPLTNYTGADVQITSGTHSGRQARTVSYDNFGGVQPGTTNAAASGFGPLWTTTSAGNDFTILSSQLPAGDWSGSTPLMGTTTSAGTAVTASGTTDGAGTTTTVIDSTLGGVDDEWAGALLEITSGAASGEIQTVTTYVASTGTLTVSAPYSVAIGSGETYQLTLHSEVIDNTLGGVDGQWVGAQVEITSGAASGEISTVQTYVAASGTLTVSPGFSAAIASGTTYELTFHPTHSPARVRITAPLGSPLMGQTREIETYTPGVSLTIDPANPFFQNVPAGTEFALLGPYTTTSGGTDIALVCDNLPGTLGQYVGGSVRITASSVPALVNQTSRIVAYNPGADIVVVANPFTVVVPIDTEFELDGFTIVDSTLGPPAPGETWEGARVTITETGHAALGQVRNVAAWSPPPPAGSGSGTFRLETPFPVRIDAAVDYEIFLAIFTLDDTFVPSIAANETFDILSPGLNVPNWYLNGIGFANSGVSADGKIVVGAEDDANRDGDADDFIVVNPALPLDAPGNVIPNPDSPPVMDGNTPDLYMFITSPGRPIRFSIGPWGPGHGLTSGGPLRTHRFRFRVRYGTGSPPTEIFTSDASVGVCGSGPVNRDELRWKGIFAQTDPDPLSIYDQPPWLVNIPSSGNTGFNTADDGTGSSIYTFQVTYRHPDGLPPRFNVDGGSPYASLPAFQGRIQAWGDGAPVDTGTNDWFYSDADDPWLSSNAESGVAVIIDGDFTQPHFMVPIDANGNELPMSGITQSDYQAGVRFVYQILPTGYR